eukprot:scaffold40677_cov66-Phaeocystis_antarctica.AAC.1
MAGMAAVRATAARTAARAAKAAAARAKAAAEWAAAARATLAAPPHSEARSAACTDGVVATGIHARCPVRHATFVVVSAHDSLIDITPHPAGEPALESSARAWLAIVLVGA